MIESILTNAYNKGIHYWRESLLLEITHLVYQYRLKKNKNKYIEQDNEKIDIILSNLKIDNSNKTLDEKLDNIIVFTKHLKKFN
jgi:molybdopterin-guanine dinucleotide biosynthesis protein A